MTLRTAAAAVLARWDSPQWEWTQHGPTADLMHVLRAELAQPAAPDVQPVAWIDKHGNIDRGLDAILSPDGWIPLYAAAQAAQPAPQPLENDWHNIALNTMHKRCHEAADAFWAYWNENGETHKRGYYESTWGAINRALRMVGITEHVWPQPSDAAAAAINRAAGITAAPTTGE